MPWRKYAKRELESREKSFTSFFLELAKCNVASSGALYLLDKTLSERTQSNGHESSVVEDHGLRVHLVDVILDVGHEELVSSHVVPIVQCVVVDGA